VSRTILERAGRLAGEERSCALATIVRRKVPTPAREGGAAEVAL